MSEAPRAFTPTGWVFVKKTLMDIGCLAMITGYLWLVQWLYRTEPEALLVLLLPTLFLLLGRVTYNWVKAIDLTS